MRIGLSTYTYTWAIGVPGFEPAKPMGAIELLDTAAALGVHVVQFADNLPLDELSQNDLALLRDHAHELDIAIEVGTRGIDVDHLARYAELAVFFDAPFVRVVVDRGADHPSTADALTRL